MSKAKSKIKAKEITTAQLLQAVSDANKSNSCVRYGFILGAGASVTSGIPSGWKLAKRWYQQLKDSISEKALKEWSDAIKLDEDNLAASYTKIFAKRFEVDFNLGYEELQIHMDKAKPSIGYSFLAQVLAETKNKFIITTNFDTMSEDALFDIKDAKPLVLGHEVLSKFINATSPTRPTIIKIHRDFLFDPYNTDDQIEKMDELWQKALKPVLSENAMIVIGYGGNDESLMNYLKEIKNRKPIYWCYRNKKELSDKILGLLTENDFLIKIDSFDKFMLVLSGKLGFKHLIDPEEIENSQIVKNAIERAKVYAKQLEELAKDDLDEPEQDAIKKLLPSWWDYQLAVDNEVDIDKKKKIYLEGLNVYPSYYKLIGNYALFLHNICKDFDEAEKYYLQALKLAPNIAYPNGNYALFLDVTRKDRDKADKYYQRALAIDPDEAIVNSNYAGFLFESRKECDKADKYYQKALEHEPDNATICGGYANFLYQTRNDYDEADKYYQKALKLEPDNATICGGYANFLYQIRKDYDEADKYYQKALELEPDNAITNGNYANFQFNVCKDYDKAEEYNKKSLELDPNCDNVNGNYAQLLLALNRKAEADKYMGVAFDNMTENNELALELWFCRLAHYPEFFKQAQLELDHLLTDGHRSIGWNFDGNIKRAKEDGFEDIKLLENYAKQITHE